MISEATDRLSRSQPPCEAYWRRFDQLDALLRNAGFSTSPDRWQNAHDLLLKLLEAGKLPQSSAQLRSLLAPLFCHSAREQQQFTELFDQWLRLILPPAQQAQPELPEQLSQQQAAEPPPDKPRLPVVLGLLLALLLALLAGYYLTWTPDPEKLAATPITPPVIADTNEKAPASIKDLKLQPIPPRRPLELPSLDADHRAYVGAGQWVIRLLPLLLGLAWLALLWRGWQMVLARRRGERQQEDPLHAITLAAKRDELLDSAPLRAALLRLHTPVAYPTRRLHLDATVQATARHAGLLQPIYAERMAVPECVVLVDYRHGADQMAALARLVSQRLEAAGLSVHRYHYQQDPRRVRAAASAGPARWLALTELAGRYPNARLLLIGEPAPLIDPWRQALRPWAEVLAWWPQRGLLATRMPPLDWMRIFQAEGLAVTDLSSSGLASMAEHLAGLSPQEQPPTAPRVLLPRGLQNSEAWLTPLAPPESEQQALLKQLRLFLRDDGLLLFSAMAAYPQLHWGLTRALDLNLAPDTDAVSRELRLLRIARLPWCREGWLPDWLRQALQAQCGKSEQKIIANLYQQLLGLADIDGKGEISLPFDLSQPAATRGLRSWLQRLTQLAPQESSLHDRIFANALLGSRRRSIDFLMPRKLASHLPAGTMRLLLPRLLLVVLLGGLAGWGAGWAWDRWLRNPATALAQKSQLADHGRYRVQILHTGETLQLAQALSDTLNQFGIPAPEMRELSADELTLPDRAEVRVNSVQVGVVEDAASADFLARRLAYLTWGLKPVVADQLSEAVVTDQALQQPPKAGELRIWLLTPGRTGSPFSDRLREPLTEAQLQRWRNPPESPRPEESPQPAVEQEAAPEQTTEPQPQPTTQQPDLAKPLPAVEQETAPEQATEPKPQSAALAKPLPAVEQETAPEQATEPKPQSAAQQPDLAKPQPAVEQETAPEQTTEPKPQSTAQQPDLAKPLPSSQPQQLSVIQDKLNDGSLGPEMLVIPAGSFMMGSPDDEPQRNSDEGPQHQVEITNFAIGRTEVTFEQYDRFARATGRKLPDDRDWGRGNRPVIYVKWEDATAYAAWLSEQTGQRYRLPSEAEWEYAARAGTLTPFSTGDCINTDQANYNGKYDYADCGAKTGLYRAKTVPAGSLPTNPWGLHEVHGNSWEWVQDCWHPNYEGAPNDGSTWEAGGDCALRVVRGGGWLNRPGNLRSARRDRFTTGVAYSDLGFRLARTL